MSATDYPGSRSGPSTWILTPLAALTLLLSTACSTVSVIEIDPRLTAPCEPPELRGNTWRDVGILAVEQRAVIDDCDQRMRAIRETVAR